MNIKKKNNNLNFYSNVILIIFFIFRMWNWGDREILEAVNHE